MRSGLGISILPPSGSVCVAREGLRGQLLTMLALCGRARADGARHRGQARLSDGCMKTCNPLNGSNFYPQWTTAWGRYIERDEKTGGTMPFKVGGAVRCCDMPAEVVRRRGIVRPLS